MSVCDPVNGMHTLFTGILPKHLFVERPNCRFDSPFDPDSLRPMRDAIERHAEGLAAVILEPIVQGAGGMWFYHPDYLRGLRKLCDEHELLLIVDEIATDLGVPARCSLRNGRASSRISSVSARRSPRHHDAGGDRCQRSRSAGH